MNNFKKHLHNSFVFLINFFMWLTIGIELSGLIYDIIVAIKELQIYHLETQKIVIKILNVLIIYELFTTLLLAFEKREIKLSLILDTALIFVIRELLIIIFSHKNISIETGISYSLIIAVLGTLRILNVKFKEG